jgi:metallo-beta-lactamase family protein
MLPDAGRLAEEDAKDANRAGYTRHAPALPLFTEEDALRALTHLQPVGYERPMPAGGGIEIEFHDAGHLLGSSFVRMSLDGTSRRTLLFGGDLGRYGRPVLPDPQPLIETDVLLVESTYGDRLHGRDDDGERIASIINDTLERGGKIIVPAFAVGRVEEVIYWLKKLEDARRIPVVPVYLDSPMAIEALRHYSNHSNDLDPDMQHRRGQVSAFTTKRFTAIPSVMLSKQIQSSPSPCIVISASGMATGGRVLYYLKTALPNPRNTILFVGYQAAGTRGRTLVEGEPEVKIHGQMIPVHARIERIDSMSAHADADEIVRWLRTAPTPPSMTYLVHGEPAAQAALDERIGKDLGWTTHIADYREQVTL